jgi:two-component system, NtrC family, sensor kinase
LPDRDPPFTGVVTTIAAKCRRCYNCVRSCPAKAIRVQGGQACVIEERCIGCGNCLRVCAQNAKQVQPAIDVVFGFLADAAPCVAVLAPSYPAAYAGIPADCVVAACRALGFARVIEVGFGAEMVAREYAKLLKSAPERPIVSTPCPALVSYVEKYMPDLVPNLAPIVSPMVAIGRAIKQKYLPGAKVVFIGPCVAKKVEIRDPAVADAIDAAVTFRGLHDMLEQRAIDPATLEPSIADEPLPRYGAVFPLGGGLLKTAAIRADLMDDSIAIIEGPNTCLSALRELRTGGLPARFLDALLCKGCIAGPAFSGVMSPFTRKALVTEHVRRLEAGAEAARLEEALAEVADVDLSREFTARAIPENQPTQTELRDILALTNKLGPEDELNCGACGYPTCRDKAIAVHQGLAEPEMCLPYLIDQLQINLQRLSRSKEEIEKARELAMRAQQLANMGQLAADIAHEISNPLGNIVVFAQLLRDELPDQDARREDVATIIAEALHCREVMSSLQGFARQQEPQWEQTSVAEVVRRAVIEVEPRLAFSEVELSEELADDLPPIVADPGQLAQVVANVLTNAIEAYDGPGNVTITTRRGDQEHAEIVVTDTGRGIEPDLVPRIFQPFVTTKDARRGAGLGLAVAHGIMQAHGGDIHIESKPGAGTAVTINVPLDLAPTRAESAKVLVVDDDPDFLEQHRLMLAGMGFDVVTAERSDEALEVSNREIPDAFVLDLMMERTDSGARLARALRRDPRFRHAPIVMLTSVVDQTGFEFSRNPREVLEWIRADAWFNKPAPVAELATTIRRLLAGTREEQGEATEAPEPSS